VNFSFKKAERAQRELLKKLKLVPLKKEPQLIGGCDLTFLNPFKNPTLGIGAFVILKYPSLELVEKVYDTTEVEIPYVPGFLAFREVPLLIKTYKKLKTKPDLIVVDGHGIAHPRRLGIATHFGIVMNMPTIGCAKKPLYGEFEPPCNEVGCKSEIRDPKSGELLGYALRTRKGAKPIYVSPGNLITPQEAIEIALTLSKGYRIPEPTRLAHNYLQTIRKGIIQQNLRETEERNGHRKDSGNSQAGRS